MLVSCKYEKEEPCTACQIGKQTRTSFKVKYQVYTKATLQLLDLDLFGHIGHIR